MNPYPFVGLNHFTVPVATITLHCSHYGLTIIRQSADTGYGSKYNKAREPESYRSRDLDPTRQACARRACPGEERLPFLHQRPVVGCSPSKGRGSVSSKRGFTLS